MSISITFQKRFIELVDELSTEKKTACAENIGITYVTFSKVYNYGIVPKTGTLIKIADFFNVSVKYLLGETDDEYFERAPITKTFQVRLRELLNEKKLTVYALAENTHIHRNNIAQWLKNFYIPSYEELVLLADCLSVSVDYLLGRTDDRNDY